MTKQISFPFLDRSYKVHRVLRCASGLRKIHHDINRMGGAVTDQGTFC